jgi:hypothetical protein
MPRKVVTPTAARRKTTRQARATLKAAPPSTDRWIVSGVGADAKWVTKSGDPTNWYSPNRNPPNPIDMSNLPGWVVDMHEWSLMMREAVIDLRARVKRLEGANR